MFLGQVMRDARKHKGLSQVKLAEGICDQNIISLLERKNTVPRINRLVPLLQRLDLSLNDVFTEFSSDTTSELHDELVSLEQRLLLGDTNVESVSEEVETLNLDTADDGTIVQYEYILSLIKLLNKDTDGADFQLDKVLFHAQTDIYNVYTILAYLNKALIRLKLDRLEEAAYFIETIRNAIKKSYDISNATDLQLIYICLRLAQYFSEIKDQKLAINYADEGLKLNQAKQRAYFLGDFYMVKVDNSTDASEQNQNRELAKLFKNYTENK